MLFIDDDVVLLKNPFALFSTTRFDFRHQIERGSGCSADANGGQLYVRATPRGIAFLDEMVSLRGAAPETHSPRAVGAPLCSRRAWLFLALARPAQQ